jgi:hypothetical protein
MSSRSALTKLKAILVIDLILVAAAAGAYLYLQNEGLITGAARPPEFVVTDLTIAPLEAEAGDPVLISVNATNIGDIEGVYSANLTINDALWENQEILLWGKESKIVEFEVFENTEGDYGIEIDGLLGAFKIRPAPPEDSNIVLSNLRINPYESWVNDTVTATLSASNPTGETDSIRLRLMIDGTLIETRTIELSAGDSTTVEFAFTATAEGKFTLKINTLSGTFQTVKTGFHTLTINRSGGGSTPLTFTLNGVTYNTPYTELLPAGQYSISAPDPVDVGTGVLAFSYWSDGVTSRSRTFTLDRRLFLIATYTVISGYASCPSLYYWNGTHYVYVTEISNAGWLGYMDCITENGDIVFGGGNPWDYVKLDKNQLQMRADPNYNHTPSILGIGSFFFTQLPFIMLMIAGIVLVLLTLNAILVKTGTGREKKLMIGTLILSLLLIFQLVAVLPFALGTSQNQGADVENGYYDIVLFQQWDEIFYLDATYLLVVDHPIGTDVYSTMSNYVNPGFNGQIYTVSANELSTPIQAFNEKGEDMLPYISQLDGVFTPGSNGLLSSSWDNLTLNQLTLNLGDLSNAPEIKLVIHGMVDWGPPEPYYEWIDHFLAEFSEGLVPSGTQLYPPPYMEVKDVNGDWKLVPQDRQMPIPSDYVPRSFVVDLTELFPEDILEYQIRITNFWNVTFDYIGIDITPQQSVAVHRLNASANLDPIDFGITVSNASGNFTRYGDVTQLLLEANDMFVIGMQGDQRFSKVPR